MISAGGVFIVGISGPSLTREEREIFREAPPSGVILFARNIASEAQLDGLSREIREALPAAFLCVDQEGGPVDRFRTITGGSPSLSDAARAGRVRDLGALCGELCARFSIALDLAPVVDRAVEGAGARMLAGRCAGPGAEEAAEAGAEFLAGLSDHGVSGCLKHFPGLGRAALDTHLALPAIRRDEAELERDLLPFRRLAGVAPAVMVSHAAFGGGTPASLDWDVATVLLRDDVGFGGVAISDDLEMGALSGHGSVPERSAAAFSAGCDLLCLGRETSFLPDAAREIERSAEPQRMGEAARRVEAFRRRLAETAARAVRRPRPLREVASSLARLTRSRPP